MRRLARLVRRAINLSSRSNRREWRKRSVSWRPSRSFCAGGRSTKQRDFGIWKQLDAKEEVESTQLATFLAEVQEMARAQERMLESPRQLEGGGFGLFSRMDPTSVRRLIEFFRRKRGIVSRGTLDEIVKQAYKALRTQPNVTFVEFPPRTGPGGRRAAAGAAKVTVVGDLHGDLDDLLHVVDTVGMPARDNVYIFNGDFVDRGKHGAEVLALVLMMKVVYPDAVHINRGNHEDTLICRAYGFYDEIMAKYHSRSLYSNIVSVFAAMPLAAVVEGTALVVHGGVPSDPRVTLSAIDNLNRFTHRQTFTTADSLVAHPLPDAGARKIIEDLVWSDPDVHTVGVEPTGLRGAGCVFGPDATREFLSSRAEIEKWAVSRGLPQGCGRVRSLVRSHECVEQGTELFDCGNGHALWTVFSASNYGGGWNQGAVLQFVSGLEEPQVLSYETDVGGRSMRPAYDDSAMAVRSGARARVLKIMAKYREALRDAFAHVESARGGPPVEGAAAGLITDYEWETVIYTELGLTLNASDYVQVTNRHIPGNVKRKARSRRGARGGGIRRRSPNDKASFMVDYNGFLDQAATETGASEPVGGQVDGNARALEAMFKMIDIDGNGKVDFEEFKRGCTLLNHRLQRGDRFDASKLFSALDQDKDGCIGFEEIRRAFSELTTVNL